MPEIAMKPRGQTLDIHCVHHAGATQNGTAGMQEKNFTTTTMTRALTNLAGNDEHKAAMDERAKSLEAAVASTFPPDGKIPQLQPGTWAPLLVDP